MSESTEPCVPLAPEEIEALQQQDVEGLRAVVMEIARQRAGDPKIGNRNAWLLALNGPLRLAANLAAEIGTDPAALVENVQAFYRAALKEPSTAPRAPFPDDMRMLALSVVMICAQRLDSVGFALPRRIADALRASDVPESDVARFVELFYERMEGFAGSLGKRQ